MLSNYRVGMVIGEGSIGWCVLKNNASGVPSDIINAGVRIFTDGRDFKTRTSLCAERGAYRRIRRNRERYKRRVRVLTNTLNRLNLPTDNAVNFIDPYKVRYEALDRKLQPRELGIVFRSLNKKRGFKSNRLCNNDEEDAGNDDYQQLINDSSCRTLGEFLWLKNKQCKESISQKIINHWEEALKNRKDRFLRLRGMIEYEFKLIVETQKPHYPHISDTDWKRLYDIIFYQRPLKPQEKGYCELYAKEKLPKAYAALVSAQKYKVLKAVSNLIIAGQPVNAEHKKKIYELMCSQKSVTFKKIRKLLSLEDETIKLGTNGDEDKADRLEGIDSEATLRKYFLDKWNTLSLEDKDYVVEIILESQDKDEIKQKIQHFGLDDECMEKISMLTPGDFKNGESRLSARALREIVPMLENGLSIEDSEKSLGFDRHAKNGKVLEKLPYYGLVMPEVIANRGTKRSDPEEKISGIFGNPTIHISLNQLRHLMNAIIGKYGHPTEVSVEISRDLKMSAKSRKNYNKIIKDKEKKSKEIYLSLLELNKNFPEYNINFFEHKEKYELWDELGEMHQCPFTGKPISITALFSEQIAVEHILPLSDTLDDSMANKTICFVEAKLHKNGRSPYDAFGSSSEYNAIIKRTSVLPNNKSWRFEPDAMDQFINKDNVIFRQLNENKYISRVVSKYLGFVCNSVRVSAGRLTNKIRSQWGLSGMLSDIINANINLDDKKEEIKKKNKEDHRHHAVDAIVVGLIDQDILTKASNECKKRKLDKLVFECPISKDVLINQIKSCINKIIVSYAAEHSTQGKLHDETNYGKIKDVDLIKAGYTLVTTKNIVDLSSLNDVFSIRSPEHRSKICSIVKDIDEKSKDYKEQMYAALSDFSKKTGIKRVRVMKRYNAEMVEIRHGKNKALHRMVISKNVHCVKFLKNKDEVVGVGVSLYEKNLPKLKIPKKRYPAAKFIMTLHKGDMIELDHNLYEKIETKSKSGKIGTKKKLLQERRIIARVISLRPSESNQMVIYAPHQSTGKDMEAFGFRFSTLIDKNVKKISVNILGTVR